MGPRVGRTIFQSEIKSITPKYIFKIFIYYPPIYDYVLQVAFISSDPPNRTLCVSLTVLTAVTLPASAILPEWTILMIRHELPKTALAVTERYKPSRR
jgi:hypothetical protein